MSVSLKIVTKDWMRKTINIIRYFEKHSGLCSLTGKYPQRKFTSESEIAETLNNLFSNIVNKLEIAKFDSKESFTENTKDPVSEVILK